jgi:hypothetical protein
MRIVPITVDEYHVLGKAGVWVQFIHKNSENDALLGDLSWLVSRRSEYYVELCDSKFCFSFTRTADYEEG